MARDWVASMRTQLSNQLLGNCGRSVGGPQLINAVLYCRVLSAFMHIRHPVRTRTRTATIISMILTPNPKCNPHSMSDHRPSPSLLLSLTISFLPPFPPPSPPPSPLRPLPPNALEEAVCAGRRLCNLLNGVRRQRREKVGKGLLQRSLCSAGARIGRR